MNDSSDLRTPFCFARLHGDMGLTKTYFGRKIIINTRNIHTYNLIDKGIIEAAICALFEQHIRPGDVVVDAGANIGFLTLLAGHLVGPEGRVIAIEANPDVYATLEENIIINGFAGRFTGHQVAAYDRDAELTFTWNTHRDGSGRIVTAAQSGLAQKHCQVQATSLDKLCGSQRVDFVKLDTEGAEPYVMRGMQQLIKANAHMKVVFEWNARHIAQRDQDPQAFADFVFSHFTHVERIKSKDSLMPLSREELLALPHSNIFCHNQAAGVRQ
jgi:FkbM family methyltransferase